MRAKAELATVLGTDLRVAFLFHWLFTLGVEKLNRF